MSPFCSYFGYLFVTYCFNDSPAPKETAPNFRTVPHQKFQLEYQWQYVNFSWPSSRVYRNALNYGYYIPENVAISAIKYYNDHIFFAMPRIRQGVPTTIGKLSLTNSTKLNPLLEPYPSWESNIFTKSCTNFQSVQNMEIDKSGIMWVLDGFRINDITKCPPKLVLLDLNNNGKELLSYVFPKEICSFQGGLLSDIVIDHSDGLAYITDNSLLDPGLIVYSKKQNRAWKLRDKTMFGEKDASNFVVGDLTFKQLAPLDGLALSPPMGKNGTKTLYYSPLASLHLYSINTRFLKNEKFINDGEWRRHIKIIGKKQGQSDGMTMDNTGNLYYTLPPLYAVGRWNINSSFSSAEIIMQDKMQMIWPDSFSFDDKGNLRLLTSSINKFMDESVALKLDDKILFRIFKLFTGTKSSVT